MLIVHEKSRTCLLQPLPATSADGVPEEMRYGNLRYASFAVKQAMRDAGGRCEHPVSRYCTLYKMVWSCTRHSHHRANLLLVFYPIDDWNFDTRKMSPCAMCILQDFTSGTRTLPCSHSWSTLCIIALSYQAPTFIRTSATLIGTMQLLISPYLQIPCGTRSPGL